MPYGTFHKKTVAKKKYGQEQDINVKIGKNGEIKVSHRKEIVATIDDVEDERLQISLEEAKFIDQSLEIGDFLEKPLPPIDFGRVSSQIVKQVITGKIREATKEKEYQIYKDRVGEVISGVVKTVERNGDIMVNFGKTESLLPRSELIPKEIFRVGDVIKAYIAEVNPDNKEAQILISRTHPGFLKGLFKQESPEIYDGIVKIEAVSRDPGSRAKIAVYSADPAVDAVGACIGPRGSRVSSIHTELGGEKIDIVEYSSDLARFTVNVFSTKSKEGRVEVQRILIDEEEKSIDVIVPDNAVSIVIGRRGQNVRLASELIGWNINIISETEASSKRTSDFKQATSIFTDLLNVDDVIAQLLASEGYNSLDDLINAEESEIESIEGFDEEIAKEIKIRALAAQDKGKSDLQHPDSLGEDGADGEEDVDGVGDNIGNEDSDDEHGEDLEQEAKDGKTENGDDN